MPDGAAFDKLLQILVFGCAYRRISDESCSATTLRLRRDEWIDFGVIDALENVAREAYDGFIGLELADVAVDGCITKAPLRWRASGQEPGGSGEARPQTLDGG